MRREARDFLLSVSNLVELAQIVEPQLNQVRDNPPRYGHSPDLSPHWGLDPRLVASETTSKCPHRNLSGNCWDWEQG